MTYKELATQLTKQLVEMKSAQEEQRQMTIKIKELLRRQRELLDQLKKVD